MQLQKESVITVEQINQWQMQAVADAQKCGGPINLAISTIPNSGGSFEF
jgi:hypothetical protein